MTKVTQLKAAPEAPPDFIVIRAKQDIDIIVGDISTITRWFRVGLISDEEATSLTRRAVQKGSELLSAFDERNLMQYEERRRQF